MSERKAPPTFRYFITGRTQSGKTRRMESDVLERMPRVIMVDQTGEWFGRTPSNGARMIEAYDLERTVAALRELAGRSRWWLSTTLNSEELEVLRRVLMPEGNLTRGPAVAMGGITIALDEVDRVIGAGVSPLRDFWRRGRHAGISVAAATQRIGNVSKEVTSQCDVIGVMALHDPNDCRYLAGLMGDEVATRALAWVNGRPHRVAYFKPGSGVLTLEAPCRP